MPSVSRMLAASAIVITSAAALPAQVAEKTKAITYERDVKPIFRKRCGNCHNPERPRGELDLTSYAGVLAGGSSGKAVVAGRPEESPLFLLPAHLEDPTMPPNAPKIPEREIDTIRRWVEGGLIEKSGARPAADAAPRSASETIAAPVVPARSAAISALAVSPIAPIAAVSGHRQILLFNLHERKLLGALRFPEGNVFVLKFSNDGRTLLAAGGVGAESGKVVLLDAETWARKATLGDETDIVLAADLAPDGSRVLFGGPTLSVKVVANPTGEVLHTFRKPTDWVTATSFSPDGLLVAAGDRFGGLLLWETRSGQEFPAVKGHAKAITSMAWNAAGDKLLTASEDGSIQVSDINSGKTISRWDAHTGGVLSIAIDRTGRIASGGRDRRVKAWSLEGKLIYDVGPARDQATRTAWGFGGTSIIAGDLSGEVRVWGLTNSASTILPMPVAAKPKPMALVVPDLTPALRLVRKRVDSSSDASGARGSSIANGDLDAAIIAARESAASAERTLAALERVARSRASGPAKSPSIADALKASKTALDALQTALAADPENSALKRALDQTELAVRSLEKKLRHPNADGALKGEVR